MPQEISSADIAYGSAVAFLAGLLAASLQWNIVELVVFAAIGASGFLLFAQKLEYWKFAAGAIAVFCASALYYHAYNAWEARKINLPRGKEVSFSALVTDEPDESGNYLVLTTQLEKPYAGEVKVFAPAGAGIRYGDVVKVMGEISPAREPGDDPAAFPQIIKVTAYDKGFWLRANLIAFKAALLAKFNEVLTPDEAALLAGETFGGANGMSADLKNEMSLSGTTYIITLYGYKIAIIVSILEAVASGWIPRRARFFLILTAVALFVLMAGAPISAIRAAIMACLALTARQLGRASNSRHALVLVAAGMALFDPTLVVQAGFTLSFLSIAGIAYLSLPVKKLFHWENDNGDVGDGFLTWREATVLAVASLLPIIPILIASFGAFSLSAFPSNALIFIAVPATAALGIALLVATAISHYLALLIAKFASAVLFYQFAIIKIFAAISAPLPIAFNTTLEFLLYYAAIAAFAYFYRGKY